LSEYFICGLSVLILLLISLPYAVVYIKRDHSLSKLMISRGYSEIGQLLCEFLSHFISMLALIFMIMLFGAAMMTSVSSSIPVSFLGRFIVVLLMISSFNIFVFEITDNIVSGVLVHFFATVSMCYVSGCMYPINALPETLRKFSVYLPTGVAREFLSGAFVEDSAALWCVFSVTYTIVFFVGALAVRRYRTESRRG
jgi:ABC-type polysaccharide/polyol phosphate export permease